MRKFDGRVLYPTAKAVGFTTQFIRDSICILLTDLYADTDGLSAYYVLFCVLIMELFIKNHRNIMEMKEFYHYYICIIYVLKMVVQILSCSHRERGR